MQCVNFVLKPAPRPGDWYSLESKTFICHRCEKIFLGEQDDLYYFPQIDFIYHGHKGGEYYRAFWMIDKNTVHISSIDHPEMDAIQAYGITLDGKGDYKIVGDSDDLFASSKKFFSSMKRQNKKIEQGSFTMRAR